MSIRTPAGRGPCHLSVVWSVADPPEGREPVAPLAARLAAAEATILAIQAGRREAKGLRRADRRTRHGRSQRAGRAIARLDRALAVALRERRCLLRGELAPRAAAPPVLPTRAARRSGPELRLLPPPPIDPARDPAVA